MTVWMAAWLWQGLALALALWCACAVARSLNASTRYALWWSALIALVWIGYWSAPSVAGPAQPNAAPAVSSALAVEIDAAPEWLIAAICSIWLGGALIKLLRVIPGVYALHVLQDACMNVPAALEQQLPLWGELRGRGRQAQLKTCDRLTAPAVLGLHRPCIAIPTGLVRALNPAELDQIIVHEYAHVQRRDDWMLLVQVLFESALWIHPAAVWISRNISFERELACDDWVVSRTGAVKDYARCLTLAAEFRGRATVAAREHLFVPALFERRRGLVRRVERLLDARRHIPRRSSPLGVVLGVCAILLSGASLRAFPLVVQRLAEEVLPGISSPVLARPALPSTAALPSRPAESTPKRRIARGPSREAIAVPAAALSLASASRPESQAAVAPPRSQSLDVLTGRAFAGVYRASTPGSAPDSSGGWSAAGAAGASVGNSARKASVGLAGVFSRAGVSVAKSFR